MKYLLTTLLFASLGLTLVGAESAAKDPAKPAAKQAPALTPETLETLLIDLGYEPRDVSTKKNKEFLSIATERDNWKINISISLTTDRQYMWFELKVVAMPDPNAELGDAWFRLLAMNSQITPAYFTFNEAEKRIYLMERNDNVDLTPERMRKLINAFDDRIRTTSAEWSPKRFRPMPVMPTMTADAKLMLAKLNGTWDYVEEEINGAKTESSDVVAAKIVYSIADGKLVIKSSTVEVHADVWVANTGGTMQFDMYFPAAKSVEKGIAKLEGDKLTICIAPNGGDRPKEFKTTADTKGRVFVLKRRVG